ncbi:MAG: AAA family ATPase [Ignavibacteria bacterium]|nr:AAA family ATPase [Ignavibacteria bacterium]
MFNALLHIAACDKFFPGTPQAYLSPDASFYKNLVFCIAEAENKSLHKVLAGNNFPVDILYREVDGKVVFIFNHDGKLKGNFRLAAEIIRRLKTEYSSKIFAHCDRVIFEDEFSEHAFYYIFYNYDVPDFKKGILVSHSLFARLKNSYSFAPQKMNGGDFYFLKDEIKKKRAEFFGREKEIKTLQKSYNRLKSELSGINFNSVFISGEPGIGKTSLVNYYFNTRYCKNCFYLENENYGSAYGHFISLLKKIFIGEKPESSLRAFAAKIKDNKLKSNFNSSIPGLISLLKESSAKNTRDENNENKILAIRNFIGALAYLCSMEKSPLVIAFDDVQWADSRTVKAINFILDDFRNDFERNYSLQFIFIHRTGYKININQDAGEKEEIYLDSLEPEAAKKFIESLLLKSGLALSKKKQIELLQKSGGNPLFVQEIVEFIKDNKNAIPDSVKEIIKIRLELLPQNLVMFLKISSALGKEIDAKIVNGVLLKYNFNAITEDELYLLSENNFITINDKEIFLKHDLILEGIYDSIDKDEKKLIHERIGFEIENIYTDKIEHYYYALADHFTKAAHKEKMIEYLEKAGDRARGFDDNLLAEKYYCSCLNHVELRQSISLVYKICSVLIIIGKVNECKIYLKKIFCFLKKTDNWYNEFLLIKCSLFHLKGDYKKSLGIHLYLFSNLNMKSYQELYCKVLKGIVNIYLQIGEYSKLTSFCELLEKKYSGYNVILREVHKAKGMLSNKKGEYAKAIESYKCCLVLINSRYEKKEMANLLTKIGAINFHLQNYDIAKRNFFEALKFSQNSGEHTRIASLYGNIANVFMMKGDYKNCERYLKYQNALLAKASDKFTLAINLNSTGNLYLTQKKYSEALSCFQQLLCVSLELNLKQTLSSAYFGLGLIKMLLGEYEIALNMFEKQLKIDKALKHNEMIVKTKYNISYIYRRTGKFYEAIKVDSEAMKLARKYSIQHQYVYGFFVLSENYFLMKKYAEAINYISSYITNLESSKNKIYSDLVLGFFHLERYKVYSRGESQEKKCLNYSISYLIKFIEKIKNREEKISCKFYLWEILNTFKKLFPLEESEYRRLLLLQYIKLYRKVKKADFKDKINILNKT